MLRCNPWTVLGKNSELTIKKKKFFFFDKSTGDIQNLLVMYL